ncbi:hypothetical protein RUM43_006517 [Polyplax serrata]|uniref:I/LWEQ domain-containing protein n=1 Tax=Polyplax serrata TaxID=468196 RepID=A0AAN8PYT1_POLSC
MFDYMDDILTLQSAVFGSLNMSRCNSMMSSGQCRLAPLIPCVQDSSRLYDYCVKILFKLHSSLPPDTLIGHRDRFLKQFKVLREFYLVANNLQYFKHLIQIPLLPENPPNFLIEAELRTYVTPVVVLPEEPEADQMDGILIDSTDMVSISRDSGSSQRNGSISPEQTIDERDNLIEQLQNNELRLKGKMQHLMMEHQKMSEELRDRIVELETDLATRDSELLQEKQLKEDLLRHTEEASKYHEYEKRAKTMEEKFQKLKDVYTKLREEHIQLIRTKAEVDKQLLIAKHASEEAIRLKDEISLQMTELLAEKNKTEEKMAQAEDIAGEAELWKAQKEALQNDNLALSKDLEEAMKERSKLEADLRQAVSTKEDLDVRLQKSANELQRMGVVLHEKNVEDIHKLLEACLVECQETLKRSVDEVDNPALSGSLSSPDYFKEFIEPALSSIAQLETSFGEYIDSNRERGEKLAGSSIRLSHSISNYVIQGKTTSNSARDIEFGEKIAEVCKQVGAEALSLVNAVKDHKAIEEVKQGCAKVKAKVKEIADLVEELTRALKKDTVDILEDLVEGELVAMEKAIEEAAKRIEEMLNESRKSHSGVKLEVNEKILDSCTNLMAAVSLLIKKARLLQAEIVAQGKGTHSVKEFYKRNHQWTEGLISAAKAVAIGAKFLLTCADNVVSGQGKFEQLIVASQEVAASTAQLVVASRVKADRKSDNLAGLSGASKGVAQATASVVATAKSCSQLIEESEDLDITGLSLHQAKRLEMESQVRVLELEASLQQERQKLATLRRRHYQMAGEREGWEQGNIEKLIESEEDR